MNVTGKNKLYLGLHVKCQIFLPDFYQIWVLLTDFHMSPIPNFTEICPVEGALIHMDR